MTKRHTLGLALMIVITNFILPIYVVLTHSHLNIYFAFWIVVENPFSNAFGYFTFPDPLGTSSYWVPGVYMAFEVYRSPKNEFQTRKRFLTKIFLATAFLSITYIISFFLSMGIVIPFPIATILSIIYGVKYLPEAEKEPWIEPTD